MWERLYGIENWGLKALQALLKDLAYYRGIVDGKDGPKTREAFRVFQKGAGLPETGQEDGVTRKALFAAYMQGKRDVEIDASRFGKVAGNPWMGCAAYNRVKENVGPAPENRRVAFVLLAPSKHFPVHFPCQDGREAACQSQCKRKGIRSTPGIRCAFYAELVRENPQQGRNQVENAKSEPPWMAVARKEIGVTEIPGEKHNARILEYHRTVTNPPDNDDATGAWCASFVNWCLKQAGFEGQNTARAADWAKFGRETNQHILGAIALIHFKKGGHHVGFVAGKKGRKVLLLGGNQHGGTRVCVSEFKEDDVMTYRLPSDYKGPEIEVKELEGEYGQDDFAGTR
jgi:uncharacterized protein (TIGR02594 family)